jgi:hypothetical protein
LGALVALVLGGFTGAEAGMLETFMDRFLLALLPDCDRAVAKA